MPIERRLAVFSAADRADYLENFFAKLAQLGFILDTKSGPGWWLLRTDLTLATRIVQTIIAQLKKHGYRVTTERRSGGDYSMLQAPGMPTIQIEWSDAQLSKLLASRQVTIRIWGGDF